MEGVISVYVKHPTTFKSDELLKLLNLCGKLLRWKPMKDPSTDKPKNFGFAEFADMKSAARAQRLLANIPLDPWLIKVDKNSMQKIDLYNRSLPSEEQKQDISISQEINSTVQPMMNANSDNVEDVSLDFLGSVLVSETENNKGSDESSEKETKDIYMDEEEEIRRMEEERLKSLQKEYENRVQKWISREAYRAKLREESQRRAKEFSERIKKDRSILLEFYENYDDDEEERMGKDLWFTDREKWIENRRYSRDKEMELDRREIERSLRKTKKISLDQGSHTHTEPAKKTQKLSLKEFKARLGEILKNKLPILKPLNSDQHKSESILSFDISWDYLNPELIERKLVPLIDNRLKQFLGQSDGDLVEFVTEAIVPAAMLGSSESIENGISGKKSDEVLEEIYTAFGETDEDKAEALNIVEEAWKCLIWETEKTKLLGNAELVGFEGDISDISVHECLF